jgi:hypothetical protein
LPTNNLYTVNWAANPLSAPQEDLTHQWYPLLEQRKEEKIEVAVGVDAWATGSQS